MIFYIADLHFGHKNIIRYDNRPFKTIEEMDREIIKRWNDRVSENDTVYILGDVSWYGRAMTNAIMDRLNGKKIFIRGNHDKSGIPYLEIEDKNRNVVLSHYPIVSYKNIYHGTYHLYGHVHNGVEHNMTEQAMNTIAAYYEFPRRAVNVGCMMPWMDYTPRTLDELTESVLSTFQ